MKYKNMNRRQLKKHGMLVEINEPIYVNGEGITLPTGLLQNNTVCVLNNIRFKRGIKEPPK